MGPINIPKGLISHLNNMAATMMALSKMLQSEHLAGK
jgi:hypothetical protein